MDTRVAEPPVQTRRMWVSLGVPAVAVVAGLLVVSLWALAWPATDPREPTDAVIVLSGESARLDEGLAIIAAGLASTLVVSNGEQPGWVLGNALCGEPQQFEVLCFRPRPQTTAGEARTIAEIAQAAGWERVTVVTSPNHVTRARLLLEQCTSATVSVVAHEAELGQRLQPSRLAREGLAMLAAMTVARAC